MWKYCIFVYSAWIYIQLKTYISFSSVPQQPAGHVARIIFPVNINKLLREGYFYLHNYVK